MLMNTGVSLTANLSCFCLLLTHPISTLYLVKTNAIYEVELLLVTNDDSVFVGTTSGVAPRGLKEMGHFTEVSCWLCNGERCWPCWVA